MRSLLRLFFSSAAVMLAAAPAWAAPVQTQGSTGPMRTFANLTFATPKWKKVVNIGEVINFETFQIGTILSSAFSNQGSGPVLVSGLNPSFVVGTNAAVVFDSANPSGGDTDLATPHNRFGGPGFGIGGQPGMPFENAFAQGKVLIIGEGLVDANGDGFVDDPDDADLVGAMIMLDFTAVGPVTICRMRIVDLEGEEQGSYVEGFNAAGVSLGQVDIPDGITAPSR